MFLVRERGDDGPPGHCSALPLSCSRSLSTGAVIAPMRGSGSEAECPWTGIVRMCSPAVSMDLCCKSVAIPA
eukprot:4827741-Pyramimonas_sp.AAC.1